MESESVYYQVWYSDGYDMNWSNKLESLEEARQYIKDSQETCYIIEQYTVKIIETKGDLSF